MMATDFWQGKTGAILSQLLGLEVEAGASSPLQKADTGASQWYDGTEVKSLTLEQILKEEISSGSGDKVFTVTLDDFATAVGDKWSRLKVKVDLIADGVARRHVGKGILCSTLADGSLMITVLGQGSAEGRQRVVGLADDLGHRLVGAVFDGQKERKTRITEVDPADLLGADGNVSPDVWTKLAQAPELDVAEILQHQVSGAHDGSGAKASPEQAAVPHRLRGDAARPDPTEATARPESAPAAPVETAAKRPEWHEDDAPRAARAAARADKGLDAQPRLIVEGKDSPIKAPEWYQPAPPHPEADVEQSSTRAEASLRFAPLGHTAEAGGEPGWSESETRHDTMEVERTSTRAEASLRFTPITPPAEAKGNPQWGRSETRADATEVGQTSTRTERAPALMSEGHAPSSTEEPGWKKLERTPSRPSKEERPKLSVVYRPTWNASAKLQGTHCCVPVTRNGGNGSEQLDFEMTLALMAGLNGMPPQRPKGIIILPLHFASLCGTDTAPIQAAIGGCSGVIGTRDLMIEVFDIPRTVTAEALDSALTLVRPHCHGLLLRTDLFSPLFETLVPCVPTAIGVDLDSLAVTDRTKKKLLPALAAFRLGAWGIPGYLWGAGAYWEIAAAVKEGFVMTNGAPLIPDMPTPGTLTTPLALADFKPKSSM